MARRQLVSGLANRASIKSGLRSLYILAPQLDVMKEQAEKRGAERMLEATRTICTNWDEVSLRSRLIWIEYNRLKDAEC